MLIYGLAAFSKKHSTNKERKKENNRKQNRSSTIKCNEERDKLEYKPRNKQLKEREREQGSWLEEGKKELSLTGLTIPTEREDKDTNKD